MPDDFCLEHGFDFMMREFGNPIAHCWKCEETKRQPTFAPGPWAPDRILDKNNRWAGLSIKAADGTYVANMVGQLLDNEIANARLIAAAPTLLEALRITAGNIRSLGPAGALPSSYEVWLEVVESAIAKATG